MSPNLPLVSGRQAGRAFERIGYRVVQQRGSPIRLRDEINPNHLPLTVPNHKTIKPGLLRRLLCDADLTVEEFMAWLK